MTLVGQRVFGIALGYEDLVDHDPLRHDPAMAVLASKLSARRKDCAPLAGNRSGFTLKQLGAHKPFDFALRPVHRRVDRLAGLRALGDHLHNRRLREHLGPDLERRRVTRNAGNYIAARRIIVERALGRLDLPQTLKSFIRA